MTYLPPIFPDIETVLVAYIQTLALPSNTIVSVQVPITYDGSQSVVRVNRLGGASEYPIMDHPNVEISCWGPDRATAAALRDIVRLGMTWVALSQVASFSVPCRLSNPVERLGPQWLDEEAYMPAGRYMFEVSLDLRNV
jgi:hypothetical protein